MNKKKILLMVTLGILALILWEKLELCHSETKIQRDLLKKFPLGTKKSVIKDYADKTYHKPPYLSQGNFLDYILGDIQGIVAVTLTWEFNENNDLIKLYVQKDYGP